MLEKWINDCWYRWRWPGVVLSPLSLVFAGIVALRVKAYQWRLFKSYASTHTVVVVGNITVGGTGKTPLVIALVRQLQQQGRQVVVISRGYGRQSSGLIDIQAHTTAQECGDEPLLIFQATRAPVIVASRRIEAAQYVEQQYPHSLIICDDGLQHYALQRDVEIAVIDGQRGFGNRRLLPAGPLREPLSRLQHVDFTVVNGDNTVAIDAYTMRVCPVYVTHLSSQRTIALADLASMGPWLAMTALANPQRFFDNLRGLSLCFTQRVFPDHYFFKANDVISDRPIMVTCKDAVKLRGLAVDHVYVLHVQAELPTEFYQEFFKRLL